MPDKIQAVKILAEGGLNTSENFLLLSQEKPGSASRLINYESALSGGYRRINGFVELDSDFPEVTDAGADEAEGRVLGVWGYNNPATKTFQIYAARKLVSGATYAIYLYDSVAGWSVVSTGTSQTATGVNRVRVEIYGTQTGDQFCLVDGINKAIIFDGTTWYELDSSGAGGSGDPGGNQCLDAPSVVTYFKGSLFLSGDTTAPTAVAFSAPNDPLDWTAANGAGQQLPGFDVVQLKAFRDDCYIFGEDAIRRSIPNEAAGFVLQDVTNNLGCIARDSVIEINSNIVFFSPDGIRTVAGTDRIGDVELGPFSEDIHNTTTDIIETYDLTELCSVVIRGKTQFRYFISNIDVEQGDAYGLLGQVRHRTKSWEFSELNGIQANTCWSGYNDKGQEIVLHGGYDGNVYRQELGNSFNGENILSVYTVPYLDFGDTTIRKLMRRADLFIRTEGSFTGQLEVDYDWNELFVLAPDSYSFSTSTGFALFNNDFLFDDPLSIFGGAIQPVFKINIQGSGYSTQFSITTNSVDAPHTVQGIVVSFSIKGRN